MSTHEAPVYDATGTAPSRPLLSVNDVARYLAISRKSVYRLERSGDLRSLRVGARLRFRLSEVDAYIERQEPAP
jgi:excisionase family DNA binding protein